MQLVHDAGPSSGRLGGGLRRPRRGPGNLVPDQPAQAFLLAAEGGASAHHAVRVAGRPEARGELLRQPRQLLRAGPAQLELLPLPPRAARRGRGL